jgi:hypothetical protein
MQIPEAVWWGGSVPIFLDSTIKGWRGSLQENDTDPRATTGWQIWDSQCRCALWLAVLR